MLGRSSSALWIPAAVLTAPVVFFGVQAGADALVDALAGPDAHWWWPSEGGVVLTALVFLAIGSVLAGGRGGTREKSVAGR